MFLLFFYFFQTPPPPQLSLKSSDFSQQVAP
jgi:hypothetical protein